MKEKTTQALTYELFQLLTQLPRPRFKLSSVDGLTPSAYELLAILAMSDRRDSAAFSVTELSNRLQITPAGVTHLLNPLEEAGYIARLPAAHDRRIVLVGLTAKGLQAAQAMIAEVQRQMSGLITHLGEDDTRTMLRLMSAVIEYFATQTVKAI